MAKRQRNQQVTVAFNYLVKSRPNEADPDDPIEEGFTRDEFQRILDRIRDTRPRDENDHDVITAIKTGKTYHS